MLRQFRYQTGEIDEIVAEMKKGNIPCMDVIDSNELEWVIKKLQDHGVYKVEGLPYDKTARDTVKEPEFEFRIAFSDRPLNADEISGNKLMYIDFYFEPIPDRDYDPIFWD